METKGITIEFYGKDVQLQDTITDINKGLRLTKTEVSDLNKNLKLDPTNVELLDKKLKGLRQESALLTEKVKYFEDELSKLGKEDIGSDKWNAYTHELNKAQTELLKVNNEIDKTSDKMDQASSSALKFGDILKANVVSEAIISGIKVLATQIVSLASDLHQWAGEYRTLQVYEKQFESNLKNTANATDKEIEALKKLAKEKERNGVISSKSITSAYQELATYVESADAIAGLTDALTDMAAQQYGVDATEESVRNLATTLGKALANGDYSGLTRLGYGFDEQQKYIMKYGDELERVAVLNDVIESSIGGVNEALAQTDAGKIFEMTSYFDDVKASLGEIMSELEIGFIEEILPVLQPFIEETLQWVYDHKDEMVDAVRNIVEKLTSKEAQQFFKDVANLVIDLGKIIEKMIVVIEKIGLIDAAWNVVKGTIRGVLEIFDAICADIAYIKANGFLSYFGKNYGETDWSIGGDSFTPGWSGGYGALNSGGFMMNPTFNITTTQPVTRETVKSWAGWLVDDINEGLGRMV